MSCGVGCRHSLDLALWLWCRPVATTLSGPLAWEPPYATRAALKRQQQQQKKKKKKKEKEKKSSLSSYGRKGIILGSEWDLLFTGPLEAGKSQL